MSLGKILAWGFFLLLLAGICIPAGLNYSGFCMSQHRWLTDDERVRLMIQAVNDQDFIQLETPVTVGGMKTVEFSNPKYVKYKNVDEFLLKNPNCCFVNPRGGMDLPPPTFLNRILGNNSADVIQLKFLAHYIDKNGQQQSRMLMLQDMLSNCGGNVEY